MTDLLWSLVLPLDFQVDAAGFDQPADFDCPYCGRVQVVGAGVGNFGGLKLWVRQCMSCKKYTVSSANVFANPGKAPRIAPVTRILPTMQARLPKQFNYVPEEVISAYRDACLLFPVHVGASGAFCRRAIEIVLDRSGYSSNSLAKAIGEAQKETDIDKRLPRNLLRRLDYVKEIGNFALHVRRDDALVIVDISPVEVEVCLTIVEELIEQLFEARGEEYVAATAANEKLRASGKKEMPLPPLPDGVRIAAEGETG